MNYGTVEVIKDGEDHILDLGPDLCKQLGWNVGDTIEFIDNKDGSFTMKKIDTKYVLVETVTMFRHRYLIEADASNPEWALDVVVCKEAKELSQSFIDESIISHRVVADTYTDALKFARDELNSGNGVSHSNWSDERIAEVYVTKVEDYDTNR